MRANKRFFSTEYASIIIIVGARIYVGIISDQGCHVTLTK